MNYKALLYNLLFLLVPIAIIMTWFSYDKAGGSAGGGYYDLGNLYSSLIITGYIVLYMTAFAVRVSYLYKKNKRLSAEGVITILIALALLICFIILLSLNLK